MYIVAPQVNITVEVTGGGDSASSIFLLNSQITLNCFVNINNAVNTPVNVSITWYKNGLLVPNVSQVINPSSSLYYRSIQFDSLTYNDDGNYTCTANVTDLTNDTKIIDTNPNDTKSIKLYVDSPGTYTIQYITYTYTYMHR